MDTENSSKINQYYLRLSLYTDFLYTTDYEKLCKQISSDKEVNMLLDDYPEMMYNAYMNEDADTYYYMMEDMLLIGRSGWRGPKQYDANGVDRNNNEIPSFLKLYLKHTQNDFFKSITIDKFVNIYIRFADIHRVIHRNLYLILFDEIRLRIKSELSELKNKVDTFETDRLHKEKVQKCREKIRSILAKNKITLKALK